MRKGAFVVLEGPDKSGKSTQAALLTKALRRRGVAFVHTREPGGTAFAEAIREILLDPRHRVAPLAELLLYEAARAQHTEEKIRPALRDGKLVVCERYGLASLAYQGYGRGFSLPLIRRLNALASGGLRPDLTIVLDMPESEFGRRRRRVHDRIERESAAFRARVREGYRRLARKEPKVVLVPRGGGMEDVHRKVLSLVKRFSS
ncbi:MAG: dTMP kinase [Elusimicrobia bacterium]|nr:dTMP kinase [Elusimicrobiota bacterium]MDE2313539.1 dTMP kinase [Elusimicrobiota bacterium]